MQTKLDGLLRDNAILEQTISKFNEENQSPMEPEKRDFGVQTSSNRVVHSSTQFEVITETIVKQKYTVEQLLEIV